jgi:hypothetical protein
MAKFGEEFEIMLSAKLTGRAHWSCSVNPIANILAGLIVTTIGASLWFYSL